MMLSRFKQILLLCVVISSLFACNSNEKSKTSESVSSDTMTTITPEPATTNYIVTTPQHMMLVRHRIAGNYASWKASYDAHDSLRLANGVHSYVIGRSMSDSNLLFVAVKADDLEKVKAFSKNPNLKQAMQKSGVVGPPAIRVVTMVFQDTSIVNAPLRSMTTFPVKSWSNWEKVFKEGEQERLDNGLTVRAYGHDATDSNKVILVTAITDTAKASAYWKSDKLKERRAASGVIGQPERFIFTVVERY